MKVFLKKLITKIKKLPGEVMIVYAIIILAASLASIGSSYIINRIKIAENQTPAPIVEKPSVYPDFDAIKGENSDPNIKSIKITSDCLAEGCVNNKPASIDFDGIEKKYLVKGGFTRAYLYIEAAVDYSRPLTIYDDFYFLFNNWGGHLLTNENLLPVPPSDDSRFLYDLRSVSYFVKRAGGKIQTFENINFFVFLQNGTIFDIRTTVSSDRPGRVIKEVSLYYQCLNGTECSIVEQK